MRWGHSCFCIFFDILLHVLACSLCIQVNLIRKATCLESFNQSENSLPHVESLLPTGLSLFPKPSSTMIQVAFFHCFHTSYQLCRPQKCKDGIQVEDITIVMTQFDETEKEKHNPKFCRLIEILMT